MLKKMNLRKRLLSAFTIILIFMLMISVFAIFSLRSSNDNFNDFISYSYQADSSVKICRIQTNVAARALRDMLIDTNAKNDSVYIEKYNTSIKQLTKSMETLKQSYVQNDGLVEKYETEINNWLSIANNILEQLKSGNDAAAQNMLLNQCTPSLDKIVTIATELDKSTNDNLTQQLNENLSLVNQSALLPLMHLLKQPELEMQVKDLPLLRMKFEI